jgi:phosphonate transport system permease protein
LTTPSTDKPAASAIPAPPRRSFADRALGLVVWGGLALLLVAGAGKVELGKLWDLLFNAHNMVEFGAGFVRPDFSAWPLYAEQMWLTVEMALWGTVIAVAIAIPLGLLGSRNIAPVWIVQPVRRVMDIMRALNELVVGAIFVTAVGLGPFAGVMALAVNTGGVLGKLFSEAVEAVDPRPIEGVRATGATRLQEIVWGVVPQVAPLWTSYALYRFESNTRSATVLSLIGAGGIGQVLFDSINGFDYPKTAAVMIVIVVAVSLIDLLSQAMRRRLI